MPPEPAPGPELAGSARLHGSARLGRASVVAQGTMVRGLGEGAVEIGHGSAVLENSVVVGRTDLPAHIGHRTVFGHRCLVVGASVGDLGEIGNGTILLPGARLGDRCFTGEGTLVPAGLVVPDGAVAVGRPARVIRRANDEDLARLRALRGGDLTLPEGPLHDTSAIPPTTRRPPVGTLHPFGARVPQVDPTATIFDSAELTGDVTVGPRSIIGAGVRIIGDSHGPVRIGADVQVLENTVLHLLPDNDLVLEDGVVVGPGAMIHGCRLGRGTVVEPGAIVCDWSELGSESVVAAGAVVKQRSTFPERSLVDGFPARVVGTLDEPPGLPPWALQPGDLARLGLVEAEARPGAG